MFKPALRLMTLYRLAIEESKDSQAITSYTRWVDAVQVRGAENQEVYVMLSPLFEHIWVESKERLLEYKARSRPTNLRKLQGRPNRVVSICNGFVIDAYQPPSNRVALRERASFG